MELVAESAKLKSGSYAVHHLDGACKDVECLYGLSLDMLVLDEGRRLLRAAEKDIHDLLCLRRIKLETEDVLNDL